LITEQQTGFCLSKHYKGKLPIGLHGVTCQQTIFTLSRQQLRIPDAENTVDIPLVRKAYLLTYLLHAAELFLRS